ncbi:MAG: alpha amylase C-terminal domain-containing protein [Stigonema ocellatum SAG 48.90 = DSM 106950]|nr:alpha amylase C-terminal domain-containing protein [Stigonema ocellatum SAG 48.90 = DSM 106950]
MNKVEDMAQRNYVDDQFVHLLDPGFGSDPYPSTRKVHDIAGNSVDMPVAPFQYLETHDHSQLISFVGREGGDEPFGDRSKFYKLQPFAIALYTCQGTPMLWQGQEFAENYVLPNEGNRRIRDRRDVNWEYFYDQYGAPLIRLYRILGKLRHSFPALRSRESFYYNAQSSPGNGIVAYKRQSTPHKQIAIVFLNFSDNLQSISVPFPEPGTYREIIDDKFEISVNSANQSISVDVPPNYGSIFIK